MKRWIFSIVSLVVLEAGAVAAQVPDKPNDLGLAAGETTGLGLLYQRHVVDGWRLRASVGALKGGAFPITFAGGSVLRDLGYFPGGRYYVLTTGLYKGFAPNEFHLSVVPGLGLKWGPALFEAGASLFRTHRDSGGGYIVNTWGYALALGLGFVWSF